MNPTWVYSDGSSYEGSYAELERARVVGVVLGDISLLVREPFVWRTRHSIGKHTWEAGVLGVGDMVYVFSPDDSGGFSVARQRGWGTDVLTSRPVPVECEV